MPGRGSAAGVKNMYLPLARKHVTKGAEWGHTIGTDYWLTPNPVLDIFAAASTATGDELAENGWTATSLVNTLGGLGDFNGGILTPVGGNLYTGSDVASPNHALTDASGDLLASPAIFGDYDHSFAAARIAGKNVLPQYLIAEFFAAFTVASANEVTSAIGFYEDQGVVSAEAQHYAVIRSDGTNFNLAANAATVTAGPVIATGWSVWKIVLQFDPSGAGPKMWAYKDGVIFSQTAAVGIQDEFPLRFGLHVLTTNRIGLGTVHVYYDW